MCQFLMPKHFGRKRGEGGLHTDGDREEAVKASRMKPCVGCLDSTSSTFNISLSNPWALSDCSHWL